MCPLALLQQSIDSAHAPPALPYALGPNALDATMVASSALPADPMPAVPLAMANAVPTIGGASPCLFVNARWFDFPSHMC